MFYHVGRDSHSQAATLLLAIIGGAFVAPLLPVWINWWCLVVVAGVILLLLVGLQAEIDVTDSAVTITKRCWHIPYRRFRATRIVDVWFGGDCGLPDDAISVVILLDDGQEVSVGSSATMHALHDALARFKS